MKRPQQIDEMWNENYSKYIEFLGGLVNCVMMRNKIAKILNFIFLLNVFQIENDETLLDWTVE